MNSHMANLFTTKRFLPLFITQFCGSFNDNILRNGLVVLVTYKLLAESLFMSPALLILTSNAVFVLPFICFAGLSGQIADKYENTAIIKVVKFCELAIVCIAIYGFSHNSIVILLIAMFLMGTHSAFFGPIKYSILPDHLEKQELLKANGYIEAGTFLAILVGTLIGGLYVNFSSAVIYMMIVTAVIGLVASFYIPKSARFNSNLHINHNIYQEIFNILSFAQSKKIVYLSILGISWFWFLGAALLSQVPMLAKEVLSGDYGVTNLFLGTFSIGVSCGSLLCHRIIANEITTKYLFISALGISIVGIDLYFACKVCATFCEPDVLSSIPSFISQIHNWRILIDLFCLASIAGIYAVPLFAVIQYYATPSHRARVIAANNLYNAVFMIASSLSLSILFLLNFTVPMIILSISIANIGVALYILKLTPEVRFVPYTIVKWLLKLILDFFYKVEICGLENWQTAGKRVVIVANHISFLDPLILGIYLPEQTVFAIDKNISNTWWVKPFLKLSTAYPVNNANAMAVKSLVNAIKRGKKIIIFPEGRISTTGSLMKVYEGPGAIADKADALILPMRIDGTQYTHFSRMSMLKKRRFFVKVSVTIMPAVRMKAPTTLSARDRRKYIAEKLYNIMSEMTFDSTNYNQTIYQSFIDIAKIIGFNKVIYKDMDNTNTTYRKILRENLLFSNVLKDNSVEKESIGIMLPNYNIMPSILFACFFINRVPLLINSTIAVDQVINLCNKSNTRIILTSKRYINALMLSEYVSKLQENFNIIYLEDISSNLHISSYIKSWFLSYFPGIVYRESTYNIDPSQEALLIIAQNKDDEYKLVSISHTNILSNIAQIKSRIDFKPHDISFNTLQFDSHFGLITNLSMILSGIQTLLYHSPAHYRIIPEMVYMYDITIIFSTDPLLLNYAKYAHPYDFASVRYVFSCGDKLRESTRNLWMNKYGIRVYSCFGLAEGGGVISLNTPMHNRVGSCGKILPSIKYSIRNDKNYGTIGKLILSGPNISIGYLSSTNKLIREISDENLGKGWLDTGYLAHIDVDDYLVIKGHKRRYCTKNNEQINLDEIEDNALLIDPDSENIAIFYDQYMVLFTNSKKINSETYLAMLHIHKYSNSYMPKKIIYISNAPIDISGQYDIAKLKALI